MVLLLLKLLLLLPPAPAAASCGLLLPLPRMAQHSTLACDMAQALPAYTHYPCSK